MVERVVSSLEMTSKNQLSPSVSVAGVDLADWLQGSAQLIALHDEIAAPHRWPSLSWTRAEWDRRLGAPTLRWYAVTAGDQTAGLAELEREGAQVELTIFGLRPAFQGRGFGGAALTLAVKAAWAFKIDNRPVERVWLHTSTRDGPRALPNYLRRGFTVFATETKTEVLPDLPPTTRTFGAQASPEPHLRQD